MAALVLLSAGCRPEASTRDVSVTWTVSPDPPRTGSTTVSVALADSAGTPIRGANVDLEATMTHPGMRPERAAAAESAPGRYRADLNLTMGGDWVLIMQAELPDGRTVTHQKELPAVRSEGG